MSQERKNDPTENTLMREMRTPILVFCGAVVIALLVIVLSNNVGDDSQTRTAARTGTQISAQLQQQLRDKYDQRAMSVGPASAPVVVREFADYQCPACGAFEPTAERIREQYADNKNVRYLFYDFPLPMHANAHTAAVAAHCAAKQGGFWAYHDNLYASQRQWAVQTDPTSSFLDIAVESGVQLKPFKQCLKTSATSEIVAKNKAVGSKIGIIATPTILVNRHVYSGVQSYATINKAIQKQLALLVGKKPAE